jgi:D-alanyl-D-alanine dipeptidase
VKWLIDCSGLAIPRQREWPTLHAPRVLHNTIPIEDNGELLCPLTGAIRLHPVYSWLGFKNAPEIPQVRAGILERLRRASERLPADFELVVIDGHRSRAFQAELLTYYRTQSGQALKDARYVADPYSDAPVPPHATGGAVDLTLGWRGAVLGLGTDFDAFCAKSAPAALENSANGTARDLRRLLAAVLDAEEMVPLDTEWWHWSYGDQYWASVTAAPEAVYGAVP